MKIKKVLSLVLVFMLLLSTTSVFAAVPEGVVVFGNVAYDLQALADDSFTSEILGNYRDNNNDFAYKKIGGEWVNSLNNETTPELPATITLKKGDGTTEIITVEEPTGKLEVAGVSAINSTTLKVEFSKALTAEQKAAATFSFTRTPVNGTENAYALLAAVWAEDNKSATFKRTGDAALDAGIYKVTVTGVEGLDPATATSEAVTARTVTTVEFVGDKLVKTAATTATIKYIIKDQYGVDMTSTVPAAALTHTASWAGVTGITPTPATGTLTLTTGASPNWESASVPANILVTLVHGATAKSATVTATLGAEAYVAELAITGIGYYQTSPATTRIYADGANQATAGYLTLTAKDQYGNALTTYGQLNGKLEFARSNNNLVVAVTDDLGGTSANRPAVLNLNTTALTAAEDITVTAVAAGGATASYTVPVVLRPVATTVELGAPERLIAAGDSTNVVAFPIVVKDQFGTERTNAQKATDGINISATGTAFGDTPVWSIPATGVNAGKLVFSNASNQIQGSAAQNVTVTASVGSSVSSQNVAVQAPAYVKSFEFDTAFPTDMVNGGTFAYYLKFIDQYDRPMSPVGTGLAVAPATAPAVVPANDANATVATELTQSVNLLTVTLPGPGPALTGVGTNNNDTVNEGPYSASATKTNIAAATSGAGTATVKVTLTRTTVGAGEFSLTRQINVKAQDGTGTYTIDTIPTLHAVTDTDAPVDGSSPYDKGIVVKADGAVVPQSAIQAISFSGGDAAQFVASAAPVAGTYGGNKYVVGVKKSSGWPAGKETVSTTMNVAVMTTEGLKTISQEISASKEALRVEEFVAFSAAVTNLLTPPTGAGAVNPLTAGYTFADASAANTGSGAGYLYAKDQFGVYHTVTAAKAGTLGWSADTGADTVTYSAKVAINNPALAQFGAGDVTFTNGAANFAKATTGYLAQANKDVTITIIAADKTLTTTVKVTTMGPAPALTSATYDVGTGALVITGTGFADDTYDITKVVVNGVALTSASGTVTRDSATQLTITLAGADKTAVNASTGFNTNGAKTDALAITAGFLTDAIGNTSAAEAATGNNVTVSGNGE